MWAQMLQLIQSLLHDDQGISEESYNILWGMMSVNSAEIPLKEWNEWKDIRSRVDATDGRFYLTN